MNALYIKRIFFTLRVGGGEELFCAAILISMGTAKLRNTGNDDSDEVQTSMDSFVFFIGSSALDFLAESNYREA